MLRHALHARTSAPRFARSLARGAVLGAVLATLAHPARAQAPALTLEAARDGARRVSPELRVAREAVIAAAARERQAGALANPTLTYGREATSGSGQATWQNVIALEHPFEVGRQRSQRREAARLRRAAAEARLAAAVAQLDFEVTRAYGLAVAADRRATLAGEAAQAFRQAVAVGEQRLAAGDISGYAQRRLRLEAARYATLSAEGVLARRTSRLALSALLADAADSVGPLEWALADPLEGEPLAVPVDSLRRLAVRLRADLRAADLDAEAAAAEARLVARERLPTPRLLAGFKNERATGSAQTLSGFVAGISLPLPLFDRRAGSIGAADAEVRRRVAEAETLRRLVAREVVEAHDALRTIQAQLATLAPELGMEAVAALGASQVAYAEGEITLVEWLDAVRAYREAEASYATLRAEALIQRAALDRAVGAPLTPRPTSGSAPAPRN